MLNKIFMFFILSVIYTVPATARAAVLDRTVEVVYNNVTMADQRATLAVEKIIEDKKTSYNVRFFGGYDTFTCKAGEITISSFEVKTDGCFDPATMEGEEPRCYIVSVWYKTDFNYPGKARSEAIQFEVNKYNLNGWASGDWW